MNHTPQGNINKVEELPQNMYRISSDTENIIMEAPQKMPISACSATLAYNMIYIMKKFRHLLWSGFSMIFHLLKFSEALPLTFKCSSLGMI